MSSWKKILHKVGFKLEDRFDQLRHSLKKRLGYDQPIQLVPYASYGNAQTLVVRGRALEDKGCLSSEDDHSIWQNLMHAYQRFESDEIPHLHLNVHLAEQTVAAKTDSEGYFYLQLPTPEALTFSSDSDSEDLWHSISLSVPEQAGLKPGSIPEPVNASVLIPPADCDFGIISDIDDTIMVTEATSLLRMARLTFLESPATRLPFPGVSAFYRTLTNSAGKVRPVFYVSSSPWNLYDFLQDFMRLNGIPFGPLLLRDFGLDADKLFQSTHHSHKLTQITKVMDTYPDLAFILIGDSGQHDPEIYSHVVSQRPQQVKAVYIRDVSEDERDEEVRQLARQTQQHGIDLLLVSDTLEAAEHAARQGWINAEALQKVQADFTAKDGGAEQLEQALAELEESEAASVKR